MNIHICDGKKEKSATKVEYKNKISDIYITWVKSLINSDSDHHLTNNIQSLKSYIYDNEEYWISGYEVITGACVPYYIINYNYINQYDMEERWEEIFTSMYDRIFETYLEFKPDGDFGIYCFDSSGYEHKTNTWIINLQFIVRNVGYCISGTCIPQIEGTDESVYKQKGNNN